MDVDDEGSFTKNILRELHEELGLNSDEIKLRPLINLTQETITTSGESISNTAKIFIAQVNGSRFLHVYEGKDLFKIPKTKKLSEIKNINFAFGVIETLEVLLND